MGRYSERFGFLFITSDPTSFLLPNRRILQILVPRWFLNRDNFSILEAAYVGPALQYLSSINNLSFQKQKMSFQFTSLITFCGFFDNVLVSKIIIRFSCFIPRRWKHFCFWSSFLGFSASKCFMNSEMLILLNSQSGESVCFSNLDPLSSKRSQVVMLSPLLLSEY